MEEEVLKKYILAGKIAGEALEYGRTLVKPDVKLLDVAEKIEAKIVALGGQPAFPVNISFNDTAAHYTPSPGDTSTFDNQVVKLDVGVHVDGYVGGDTATTIDLSGKYTDLVNASQKALDAALKIVKPGCMLGEIGHEIEETITSYGYKPVKNLSGHGLGQFIIHGPPTIPNFDTGDKTQLSEGMIIAIEPFATDGIGLIQDKGIPHIHSIIKKKPVRNSVTRQVMDVVSGYNGLPFANRWLTNKFPQFKVNFALKELEKLDMLHSYPPLLERAKGIVSQAEHSIYVGDKTIVMTRL